MTRRIITIDELIDLVSKHGVKLKQIGGGERIRYEGLCPWHHETTPSFQVYRGRDGRGRWVCHGCHKSLSPEKDGGDGYDWLKLVEGKDFIAAGGQVDRAAAEARSLETMREKVRRHFLRHYRDRHPDCECPDWLLDL